MAVILPESPTTTEKNKTNDTTISKIGFSKLSMNQNSEISILLNISSPLLYSITNSTFNIWLTIAATRVKAGVLNYTVNNKSSSLTSFVIDLNNLNLDFTIDYVSL